MWYSNETMICGCQNCVFFHYINFHSKAYQKWWKSNNFYSNETMVWPHSSFSLCLDVVRTYQNMSEIYQKRGPFWCDIPMKQWYVDVKTSQKLCFLSSHQLSLKNLSKVIKSYNFYSNETMVWPQNLTKTRQNRRELVDDQILISLFHWKSSFFITSHFYQF